MIHKHHSSLDQNRPIFFKIGLITALGLAIVALNWTTPYKDNAPTFEVEDFVIPDIEMVRTVHEQPRKLPPPAIQTVAPNAHIIEEEFIEVLEPKQPNVTEFISDDWEDDYEPEWEEPSPVQAPPIIAEPEPDVPDFFMIVEEMPLFGDCFDKSLKKKERQKCSDAALLSFIYQQIKYPSYAKEYGYSGTVVAEFIIDEQGNVTQPKILVDRGGGLGAEALRVIKKLPQWQAGKQRGRPVKVKMRLPIKFTLE